jgi:hypothetical protein
VCKQFGAPRLNKNNCQSICRLAVVGWVGLGCVALGNLARDVGAKAPTKKAPKKKIKKKIEPPKGHR